MEKVPLKAIAEFITTGKTPPTKVAKYFGGDIEWYTPGDLDRGKILRGSKRTLTKVALVDKKATVFPKGTLLISCIGDIGKLGITRLQSSSNQQITGVRPNDMADVNYLYYWFRFSKYYLEHVTNTAVVPILNNRTLQKIEIPLPPLAEQKKIAAILDAADQLRQKDQQLIDHYTSLSQSLFLEMFGDPVTNSMGWKLVSFGDVGKLDRGKSKHRPRNDPILLGGEHPLIQTGDVANCGGYITEFKSTYSDIGLMQSKIWEAGTLCITIAANIAKTGILNFDACFPDSVVGFKSNEKTNTHYVQHWLSFLQKILEETAPMAAQKNINLKILRELQIPLPPVDLQKKFADLVGEKDRQKDMVRTNIERSETLFNSLLQRAFKGGLTGSKAA